MVGDRAVVLHNATRTPPVSALKRAPPPFELNQPEDINAIQPNADRRANADGGRVKLTFS
jgi:hypothetical protein